MVSKTSSLHFSVPLIERIEKIMAILTCRQAYHTQHISPDDARADDRRGGRVEAITDGRDGDCGSGH